MTPDQQKILDWLDAGAPHALFHMSFGAAILGETHSSDDVVLGSNANSFNSWLVLTDQENKSDCGTICCIAGAAYLMSRAEEGQLFPSYADQLQLTLADGPVYFSHQVGLALDWLDLEPMDSPQDSFMGHDLFDPELAPNDCTPAQAAAALRRVIAGEAPWR